MDTAGIYAARWVVGKALSPVSDCLVQAWAASRDLGPNVDALKMELLYARAMLNNVRGREIHNSDLNELLQKLRDLAYDADDVLDELDYFRIQDELDGTCEAAEEHAKGCIGNIFLHAHHTAKDAAKLLGLSSCSCAARRCAWPHNTIHAIGKRLHCSNFLPSMHECVHNEKERVKPAPKLKIDRVGISKKMKIILEQLQPVIAKPRPITTPISTEPILYGRDATKKNIIDSITQGKYCERDLTVLPIVGPGGIGKTTLIQHIYNSQQVRKHFQIKVWTCVSQIFNVAKLTQEIKRKLPMVEGEKSNSSDEELIEQRLKSKRYLLILDDIWKCESDDWRRLLVPLRKGQTKGNVILVTTRFLLVTETVKTADNKIHLEGVNDEDFWELFLAYVFGPEKSRNCRKDLHDIGKDIVKKLKGSPLAAKTVGRLLSNHLDRYHWMSVLESKEWELQDGDHDIIPALKLSYDYLPFDLQQCFSLCALFPEDYEFNKMELIRFWIGQDILHTEYQNKTFEDIALSNIDSLVSHGFFKKEEIDGHPCYTIHDLLHNLAVKVASHECVSLQCSNIKSIEIRPSIRHLSIITNDANGSDGMTARNFVSELIKLKKRIKVENLQTLMIFGEVDKRFIGCFHDLFNEASALRVLHLSAMPSPVESILYKFSELIHLRYLRLETTYSSITHLPNSLSRFYHLRILDLQEWNGSLHLDGEISNLGKLHNFLVPEGKDHPAISNIGKMQYLQELKGFSANRKDVGKMEDEHFGLKQLGHLMELRELGISELEAVDTKETAAKAKMLNKNRLRKLALQWEEGRTDSDANKEDEILKNLRPHNGLQELSIYGHGGSSCPKWLGTENSMIILESLCLSYVVWKILPPLGEVLLVNAGVESFSCITGQYFCRLKRLELVGLPNLRKWVAVEVCPMFFAVLEVLRVQDCKELMELPFSDYTCCPSVGDAKATCFPRLKELEIKGCPQLASLPPIPYTQTLCSVNIRDVETRLKRLGYSRKLSELKIEGNTDLRTLNSLKKLGLIHSSVVFDQLEGRLDVEWKLPVEYLLIYDWCGSGKEMTELLFHLPNLFRLTLGGCDKITRLCASVKYHQISTHVYKYNRQVIGSNEQRQQQKVEDLDLDLSEDSDLDLVEEEITQQVMDREDDVPHPLPTSDHNKEEETVGRWGLQALCNLQTLHIQDCPAFFSAYKAPACPFPSSQLQYLYIRGHMEQVQMLDLSNLTLLRVLSIEKCEKDLSKGMWSLLAHGQLKELSVHNSTGLFAGVDAILREQEEQEQLHLLESSSRLHLHLETDDFTGVLVERICRLLSPLLTKLKFEYNNEVECFTEKQEEAFMLLTSLKNLSFWSCKKLQFLPTGLHRLTNLKSLHIWDCPSIRSLPKDGLPDSLRTLYANHNNNKKLIKQCRKQRRKKQLLL
uniref:AAA+ ATPase domain-containing protein n=1 Tax=Leersia perrieri TaxID=77586 RepID=A0A0D9WVC8_9ORYZ